MGSGKIDADGIRTRSRVEEETGMADKQILPKRPGADEPAAGARKAETRATAKKVRGTAKKVRGTAKKVRGTAKKVGRG